MKYVVVNHLRPGEKGSTPVEINGRLRQPGEVLDESEFNQEPFRETVYATDGSILTPAQLTEVQSLLKTGHIEPVDA